MKTYKANANHPYIKENTEVYRDGSLVKYPDVLSILPEFNLDWYDELEPSRWRAEYDIRYFYVTDDGLVRTNVERGLERDDNRYESLNYFEYARQAQEFARRVKALAIEYHKEII